MAYHFVISGAHIFISPRYFTERFMVHLLSVIKEDDSDTFNQFVEAVKRDCHWFEMKKYLAKVENITLFIDFLEKARLRALQLQDINELECEMIQSFKGMLSQYINQNQS